MRRLPRRAARRHGPEPVTAVAELARVRAQVERIRALCGEPEERLFATREGVSGWSPAEHVDHVCKVASLILDRLPSNEVLPKGISLPGRLVLALCWIPRGVGKSPKRVLGVRTTPAELQESLTRVESALAAVDTAAVDAARSPNVPHPRFGGLTPSQALRFLFVHTEHHLKIVRDVLRKTDG
jgi:hypothetical protein